MTRTRPAIAAGAVVALALVGCGSGPGIPNQQVPVSAPAGRFPICDVNDSSTDSPVPVTSPPDTFVYFGPGDHVHGNDDVNSWSGTFRLRGSTLWITTVVATAVGSTAPSHAAYIAFESGRPVTVSWSNGSPTFTVSHWRLDSRSHC